MSAGTWNFNHTKGSFFAKKFQLMQPTGLPTSIVGCSFRMQIRPVKGSGTVLLELTTENGGVKHYGSDLFGIMEENEVWRTFTKKVLNISSLGVWSQDYLYQCLIPGSGDIYVVAPDGAIELFFNATQSHEAFEGLTKAYWDCEIIPLISPAVLGSVGEQWYDNVDYVTLLNDGAVDANGEQCGTLVFPFGEGTFQDFQAGGSVQITNASTPVSPEGRLVPWGDTMFMRILSVQHKKLYLAVPWETEVAGGVKCRMAYNPPPLQCCRSESQAAKGEERINNVTFDVAPSGGSDLVGNGVFADTTYWTAEENWTIATGVATHAGTEDWLYQIIAAQMGVEYVVGFTLAGMGTGDSLNVYLGGKQVGPITQAGTYRLKITPATTNGFLVFEGTGSFTIDDVSVYEAGSADWTLGVGWAHDADNDVVTHSSGTNDMEHVAPVLRTADVGKSFQLKIYVAKEPSEEPLNPGDAATGTSLTVTIGTHEWVLGSTQYPWSMKSYSFTFDCVADDLTSGEAYLVLTPTTDFVGSVDGISLRQYADIGSLTIDNDAGSSLCRITSSKSNLRLACDVRGESSYLFNKGDTVLISNSIQASEDVNVYGWDGHYKVYSVTDDELVITPVPVHGQDASGVTDLVISRTDPDLRQRVLEGYFVISQNVTEGARSWS